ncbi:MAG: hypothetical protein QOJ40_210 [Verrucomicrobiota bacterium]
MSWIKRNLGFVIGSVLALALMGMTGWYLYSKWQLNNVILDQLNEQYAKLQRLNGQNPHPGSDKVDNIKAAKEQQQELRAFMGKTKPYFQRMPPIPDLPKVADRDFSEALSRTIYQLRRDATRASVNLPPKNYSFSFEAQMSRVNFSPGSLEALSTQLGEVKAICGILCEAKINSLDNLRRERVSSDDATGPQTDYLMEKSVTNQLAVLSPYELTFRCFSAELASVLAGFGASPSGLIVKSLNVELAPSSGASPEGSPATATPEPVRSTTPLPRGPQAEADAYKARYGTGSGTPTSIAAGTVPAGAPAARGGLPTVLDQKELKITMMLNVVKPSFSK